MPKTITPAIVRDATCPADKAQIEISDAIVQGLGLRVGRTGAKSWTLFYRTNGKRVHATLGSAALMSPVQAREAARQVLAGRSVRTPNANSGAPTADQLVTLFLSQLNVRPKTREDYERMIEKEILPAWRGRSVASIVRADVFAITDPIVERGSRVAANRVFQVIKALLNLAVDRDWVQVNVAQRIKRPGGRERARDRTLNLDELAQLWIAMDALKPPIAACLRLLILTAARRSEVRGMAWPEVDLDHNIWILPGRRAKNGLERVVQLSPTACDILAAQERRDSGRVFIGVPLHLSTVVQGLAARVGIPPCTVHDLRRSSSSLLAAFGTSRTVLKVILGHVDNDVTARYDRHRYALESGTALTRLDRELQLQIRQFTPQPAPTETLPC